MSVLLVRSVGWKLSVLLVRSVVWKMSVLLVRTDVEQKVFVLRSSGYRGQEIVKVEKK
jgi:hypothetical protein